MTAFDGASAKVSVFFDGSHPEPGKISVVIYGENYINDTGGLSEQIGDQSLTSEEAIELATDLISAANIRLGEQGKRQWMLPVQFPEASQ